MKAFRLILFLLVLNLPLSFLAQNYSLKDFTACEIPKMDSKEWYEFNHASDKEFVFTLNNGKIKVEKYKYSPNVILDIPIGKLIGINKGEFGGGLYFKPKDSTQQFFVNGKNINEIRPRFFGGLMMLDKDPLSKMLKDSKLIQSGNTSFVFKFNDSICFMGGVAHMGTNYGSLFKLRSIQNSFSISKGIKLGDLPSAMNIYKGVLYIAGHKGFYAIDKDWKVTTIFDNLFWDGLYPTSVVVLDRKNVFVTIRGGYVKINLENKKMTLYKAK
ncbi:hypothetical protein [Flavobacterium flavipallidum]|uniref:WG repeat protein n=1 Tax=Flavobacterium flavipallidum TaxID=3139140 RepID=A0ABU9HLT4_9FLAO